MDLKPDRKEGFTLIELGIGMGITFVIACMLVMLFRHSISVWKESGQRIAVQHEVQKIIKSMYNDVRKINSRFYFDKYHNIWINGENLDNIILSPVILKDTDDNRGNGYEQLEFDFFSIEPFGTAHKITYYLDEKTTSLVRLLDSKKYVISSFVENLRFFPDNWDNRKINIQAKVVIPETTQTKEQVETVNINFRIDNDFAVIRTM